MNKPTAGGDEDAAHGGGRRLPIYRLAGCLELRDQNPIAWKQISALFQTAYDLDEQNQTLIKQTHIP